MTSPPDPLPEIRQRRAAMPDGPLDVVVDRTEEEFYMRWARIHYGPPDEHGWRDWIAATNAENRAAAEFIAHAPTDIDWLVGEVTDRRREVDELRGAEAIVRNLAGHTPPVDNSPGLKWCGLCHAKTNGMITDFMLTPERHKRDCPWRLAQEWLAAAFRSTSGEEQQ